MKSIINVSIFALLIASFTACGDDNNTSEPAPKEQPQDNGLINTTVESFVATVEDDAGTTTWGQTDVTVEVGCNTVLDGAHEFKLLLPNSSLANWLVSTDKPGQFTYMGMDNEEPARRLINPALTQVTPVSVDSGYYSRLVDGVLTVERLPTSKDTLGKYRFKARFEATLKDINKEPNTQAKVLIDFDIVYDRSPTACQ